MHNTLLPMTLLVAACAMPRPVPPPAPLATDRTGVSEPESTPLLDDRAYRIVRLDNGLTAMLVSDPDTSMTAAAMSVRTGHYDNPDDRPGLAHFLEHMLFLGTETYPGADAFDAYLAGHGGTSNGWTDDEATLYRFAVSPGGFDGALHRLSHFFIDPSFNPQSVRQEVRAIESEYRLHIKDRGKRRYAALDQTVHPDHPARRFAIGSLETLSDRQGNRVIDDLRAFYDEFYTAQHMYLAVVGTHSLDILEGQVRSWFAKVPQSDALPGRRERPQPYSDAYLGVRIDLQQLEDVHSLQLEWPIPERVGAGPEEPASLIIDVLGDEGPGSLFAQLSERNWLTSLNAYRSDGLDGGSDLFVLNMELTREGAERIEDITAACFAAIQTLRDQPMPAHLAGEVTSLSQLRFDFASPMDAETLAETLAEGMLQFPPEAVLEAGRQSPASDPAKTTELLDRLTVERLRVIVEGPALDDNNLRAPYYDVPYRMRSLEPEEQARFMAGSDLEVQLPTPNPWIPTQTRMMTHETAEHPMLLSPTATTPEGVTIWSSPAAVWRTPRIVTLLTHHTSTVGHETPQERIIAAIYSNLLDKHLVDFAYRVKLAHSSYFFSALSVGIQLKVEGWSEIQEDLVEGILTNARSFVPKEEDFEDVKAETLQKWRNSLHVPPGDRVSMATQKAPYPQALDIPVWIDGLENISFAEVLAFAEACWRPGNLKVVTYGNVNESQSRSLAATAAQYLEVSPNLEVHQYKQLQWLPEGTERTLELDVDHDDSAISMMYMGPSGTNEWARWILMSSLLSEPFFHNLRTQQQLGYRVSLHPIQPLRVPGMLLTIQSSRVGPSVLLKRIDRFLSTVPKRLTRMDPEVFASSRQALVDQWREPPNTFAAGSGLAATTVTWMDTDNAFYRSAADALEQVTQEELVELAERLFATSSPTRMVTWSVGRSHAKDPLKGTGHCRDQACVSDAMELVFSRDFAQLQPTGSPESH
ncbi:MAG: hypothetical protein CL927_15315 [Deltaproteobacteria bacterium]|nr:hypothetical protein [Deltaproteobacteria bacterium]HCH64523.1 hypothetical protein [Deltaproteobacteria bacterium]